MPIWPKRKALGKFKALDISQRFRVCIVTDISERLIHWRESLGIKQNALAAQLGIPLRTWARYESGERRLRDDHIAALATAGCDVAWLVTGIPSTSQAQFQSMPAAPSLDAPGITLGEGEGRSIERSAPELAPEPAPEGAWVPRADVGPIVRISIAVEGVYRDLGIPVAAHEITRIAVEKYNELLDVVETEEDWPGAIKLMASTLRKEILAAPSVARSTKQRA